MITAEEAKKEIKIFSDKRQEKVNNFEKDYPLAVEKLNNQIKNSCLQGINHILLVPHYDYNMISDEILMLYLEQKGFNVSCGADSSIIVSW